VTATTCGHACGCPVLCSFGETKAEKTQEPREATVQEADERAEKEADY
jgi:hypothetical protein